MITEMRSLIGSIGYCATAVRFDISHAVSVLSRHLARPCSKTIDAAKRIIKYLACSRDFAITWSSSEEEEKQGSANAVIGAVDASFAMDTMTRKSHGGFINFVNNGAVSWKSGLQSIVTLSSCEAEYVALCSEVCEISSPRRCLPSPSRGSGVSVLRTKEGTISSKNVMKQCCMCRMRRAGWSPLFGS